jgi:hypothetical protein
MKKRITEPYKYVFDIAKSGLVAIFISARAKSKKQNFPHPEENLRIEINNIPFRELPPEKYQQLFNVPPAFNGSILRNAKKVVVFLTVLEKGRHALTFVPKPSAFIEDINIQELSGKSEIDFTINDTAEDGDRRPWYVFVFVGLPVHYFNITARITRRLWDSDDIKIIVDGKIQTRTHIGRYKLWYLVGSMLPWIIFRKRGKQERISLPFNPILDEGVHYVELWADRMPTLDTAQFNLLYTETKAEKRAKDIIIRHKNLIIVAAKEFDVDPIVVGAVIFQEQSTNVNFVDTLADYLGGRLGLNTSIGIGQVRVETARSLGEKFPELLENNKSNTTRSVIERLKDPRANIRYVAGKIAFSQLEWLEMDLDITNRPDILGTLYNIEDVDDPIKPHAYPKPNDFGNGVQKNYDRIKKLLGL